MSSAIKVVWTVSWQWDGDLGEYTLKKDTALSYSTWAQNSMVHLQDFGPSFIHFRLSDRTHHALLDSHMRHSRREPERTIRHFRGSLTTLISMGQPVLQYNRTLQWYFCRPTRARVTSLWTATRAIGRQLHPCALLVINIHALHRKNLTAWLNGDALVQAVAAQNNNTIVVIHSVGPLILEPWIDHPNVTAVIWAGLEGTEVGNALVDVVYGEKNPSGRLPYTIAKSPSDYPAQLVEGGNGEEILNITYSEG